MDDVKTIKDIARLAGVSISTVSRTINDSPKVTPKTKKKILSVIEKYDFHPNLAARELKSQTSKLIAFMIADEINEYYYNLIRSINAQINDKGYSLIVCNSFNDPEIEKNYLSLLANNAVSCVILNRCLGNEEMIARLSRKLPIVLLHRRLDHKEFHGDFIDADFSYAAYEYTKMLLAYGHRKIAFVSGNLELGSFGDRYEMFSKAMAESGIKEDEYLHYARTSVSSTESGERIIKELMSLEQPPTAVVLCHNLMCIGALRWLKKNNMRIPDDVSIVAPCNLNLYDLFYVSIYSALPNIAALGEQLASFALSRIKEHDTMPNRQTRMYVNLVQGESIKSI